MKATMMLRGFRRCGIPFALIGLLAAAGCSTPATRIKRNAEVFAAFPAEVQENVRAGRIALEYTHDMVRIALGTPQRVYNRETAGGRSEIWSYTDSRFTGDPMPLETSYWIRDGRGRLRLVRDWT
jgi:hypothetical protein